MSARTSPLPWERKGPIAQQWDGEGIGYQLHRSSPLILPSRAAIGPSFSPWEKELTS